MTSNCCSVDNGGYGHDRVAGLEWQEEAGGGGVHVGIPIIHVIRQRAHTATAIMHTEKAMPVCDITWQGFIQDFLLGGNNRSYVARCTKYTVPSDCNLTQLMRIAVEGTNDELYHAYHRTKLTAIKST